MSSNAPGYGLRVALAFGDTLVAEAMVTGRRSITVGERSSCTFVLPASLGGKPAARKVLARRSTLHLLEEFEGQIHQQGAPVDLQTLRQAGQTQVDLGPEDWAVLVLRERPDVRLVVARVRPEAAPVLARQRSDRPFWFGILVSSVAFALLMIISFLNYDPDPPALKLEDVDERMARVMFNLPPEEEEEPDDATVSDEDEPEQKARKRAGGPEGKFGRPDRTARSNIPKNRAEGSNPELGKKGLVKERDALAQSDTMADLINIKKQLGGLDDGELVIGAGNSGLSTRGQGQGGGGEGEGVIHGTGDVDVGGEGVRDRKRKVKGAAKPKERKVTVSPGRAAVKGQLSKELIDREVRRHRAQLKFCYNKQLTRHPNLSGKVTLHWIIAMDGSVKGAKVRSSSLGNKDAESCMVRALQGWRFPKPRGGVVTVDYPFFFGAK